MGRKRKDIVKKTVTLSIDPDLWQKLQETGVNRSRLFELSAKIYLKKKSKK